MILEHYPVNIPNTMAKEAHKKEGGRYYGMLLKKMNEFQLFDIML